MALHKKIDLVQAHYGGGYGSEDDFARRVPPLPHASRAAAAPPSHSEPSASNRQAPIGRLWGQEMRSLNAYERHVRMMAMYESHYSKTSSSSASASASSTPRAREITDMDLLASEHRFVMSDAELKDRSTPEKRMALFYYTKRTIKGISSEAPPSSIALTCAC